MKFARQATTASGVEEEYRHLTRSRTDGGTRTRRTYKLLIHTRTKSKRLAALWDGVETEGRQKGSPLLLYVTSVGMSTLYESDGPTITAPPPPLMSRHYTHTLRAPCAAQQFNSRRVVDVPPGAEVAVDIGDQVSGVVVVHRWGLRECPPTVLDLSNGAKHKNKARGWRRAGEHKSRLNSCARAPRKMHTYLYWSLHPAPGFTPIFTCLLRKRTTHISWDACVRNTKTKVLIFGFGEQAGSVWLPPATPASAHNNFAIYSMSNPSIPSARVTCVRTPKCLLSCQHLIRSPPTPTPPPRQKK